MPYSLSLRAKLYPHPYVPGRRDLSRRDIWAVAVSNASADIINYALASVFRVFNAYHIENEEPRALLF
jgi:hypothetical protein